MGSLRAERHLLHGRHPHDESLAHSRGLRNAPSLHEFVRMIYAIIDVYCVSHPRPPVAVTLDIDNQNRDVIWRFLLGATRE